jgi:hypothetical protein
MMSARPSANASSKHKTLQQFCGLCSTMLGNSMR